MHSICSLRDFLGSAIKQTVMAATLTLLTPLRAEAQVINVLTDADDEEQKGFSGAIEGSADWRSGNTNLLELSSAGLLRFRRKQHLVLLSVGGEYGVENNEVILNRHSQHLRYRFEFFGPLAVEAFIQHSTDVFRQIANRAVVGIGPRVVAYDSDQLHLAFAAHYMPELQRFFGSDQSTIVDERVSHRVSAYSYLSVELSKRVALIYTLFLQPALNEPSNFRMFSDLRFQLAIADKLNLAVDYKTLFETLPAPGARSVDSVRELGLQYNF